MTFSWLYTSFGCSSALTIFLKSLKEYCTIVFNWRHTGTGHVSGQNISRTPPVFHLNFPFYLIGSVRNCSWTQLKPSITWLGCAKDNGWFFSPHALWLCKYSISAFMFHLHFFHFSMFSEGWAMNNNIGRCSYRESVITFFGWQMVNKSRFWMPP